MLGVFITKIKVRQGFRQFSNHELEKFMKNWREDAFLVYPGDVPASGRIEGKTAIWEWFRIFFEKCPEMNFTVKEICVENIFDFTGTNTVSTYWEFRCTNREGYKFENNGITFMTIRFGRIVSVRDFLFNTGPEFQKAWGVK